MKLLNPVKVLVKAAKICMNMKKFILFLAVFAGISYICAAQPPKERIKALKTAYITQELNLTSAEAEKFWPVYNEYFAEIEKVVKENEPDELKKEEKILNIRKKYKPEFKKVLNDDTRVNKVFVIDRNFKEVLRKKMEERKKNKPKQTRFQNPQD
jgi:Skp family chaperone for outer membrane proteins